MAHLGLKLIVQKWSYSIKIFGIHLFEWLVGCSIAVIVFSLPGIVENCNFIYFMILETPCLRSGLTLHCKSYITWSVMLRIVLTGFDRLID